MPCEVLSKVAFGAPLPRIFNFLLDLDAELHIRVSKLFDKKLKYLARQKNVTKSTFARQVLINHISSLETSAGNQL